MLRLNTEFSAAVNKGKVTFDINCNVYWNEKLNTIKKVSTTQIV